MLANGPFEVNKNDFLTKKLLFYVFKPIERSDLSKGFLQNTADKHL